MKIYDELVWRGLIKDVSSPDLEEKLKNDGDVYYYKVVNKGLFKKKEVYIINMYTEKLYSIDDDGIKDY